MRVIPFVLATSLVLAIFGVVARPSQADEPAGASNAVAAAAGDLFRRDNLMAWCIVPFDAKKRGPADRAQMLERLGLKHFAYDYRAEHVPTFDAEIEALQKHGIALDAWWFPSTLNDEARQILNVLKRHGVHPQLWVTGAGGPTANPEEFRQRIETEAARIRPIAEAAADMGCKVGLYNHGGWFGEPENQLAIIDRLKLPNVGIVYNLHHGHGHLDRFAELLAKIRPHLLALNLNGMTRGGDQKGEKILPIGTGDRDLELLGIICESGYRGPIGILNHTNLDAEARLLDNLDGLTWLATQLTGKPAGPRPKYRSYTPGDAPAASPRGATGYRSPALGGGLMADGKDEYRSAPLTVECRASLMSADRYNILVASDTKGSGAHWEIFSMAGSGTFTAYLPGLTPDHVHSKALICDGKPHDMAMIYEPQRVRLFVDGQPVAEQAVTTRSRPVVPGGLAFGRLVEGALLCEGALEYVRLSRGARDLPSTKSALPDVDQSTVGLWRFDRQEARPVEDLSPLKNQAKVAPAATAAPAAMPPPGLHVKPADPRLKAVLIDRSANDVYLAVKCDSQGRLFVGGREAVFVFEPDDRGGYLPKQELLRLPQDSIVIGLELRGNDLYVMTSHALYLLPEGRVKRSNLVPRRILWGLPLDLHVSFHSLAWGPEGDLYLNHGDPLLGYGDFSRPDAWGHWTLFPQPAGTRISYNGTGAVWRMRPDGSDLRFVAGGLRGPVGLTFDPRWNLFTNDNDHESMADRYAPARLLHVTPQIDFGWPRGWMASKSPERSDLIEPMIATLGRGVPCDMAWYDEPFFPAEHRGQLLLCRWERFAVTAFSLRRKGASFEAEERSYLTADSNARPSGIAVGRDGRVFVTCLYLPGNVPSPYCPSDLVMITRADDPDAHPFEAFDETALSAERLWNELSVDSWERRRRAHQEVLRRGRPMLIDAVQRLDTAKPEEPSYRQLIWLTAASRHPESARLLARLARNPNTEVREQAIRALAECRTAAETDQVFSDALIDPEPGIRLVALIALFDASRPLPLETVARLAAADDAYLRQTASRLLALRAPLDELLRLAASSDAGSRLAAVLAAGMRLTTPPSHDEPPSSLALHYKNEGSFFKTKLHFADRSEVVDLRDLGRVGSYTIAEWWRAIEHKPEHESLFALLLAALEDGAPRVQAQAAYWLSLLRDPRSESRIELARRNALMKELSARPLQFVERVWMTGPFPDFNEGFPSHPPEEATIDLSAEYPSKDGPRRWMELSAKNQFFILSTAPAEVLQSHYMQFRLQSGLRQPAMLTVVGGEAARVWHNGTLVLERALSTSSAPAIFDLQPGSNEVLVRLQGRQSDRKVSFAVQARGEVTAALADKLDSALLAQRLREASSVGGIETMSLEFAAADWQIESRQGDAARGRLLFGTLGCARCHAITSDQKAGGAPSLAEAWRRFTVPQLVESILLPSKQIAAPFRGTTLVTSEGLVLSGLVVGETADSLELLLPDGSRRTMALASLEDRQPATLSPMPSGLVKTLTELRDLLSYLLLEQPVPP